MVFSSIEFLFFFLPVLLIIYYAVPFKLKNFVLLVGSLLFYSWGEPVYILLMIFSSLVDYMNGRIIEKNRGKKISSVFMTLSVIINLGMLGIFKYTDFFIGVLNTGGFFSLKETGIALPIGISFFTFQTMSYSIDVYRGNIKAEKSFLNFMTYVSMFPQLIAGPIVRFSTVGAQLAERTINFSSFRRGFLRFIPGLFKKVLIANQIGMLWESIKGTGEISVLTAWLGAVAFSLQLYFDFSGYGDMAIGLGKMLGFDYEENFNYPYISKSITEFWRRWHITLSVWFRDYVYIPLGGNRKGALRQITNIFIVWFLTGFWHGAAYNFILWGIYYGVLLVLEKFVFKRLLDRLPVVLRHIYALVLIVFGFTIFVFDDISALGGYVKSMFMLSGNGFIDNDFMYYIINYKVLLIVGALISTPVYPFLCSVLRDKCGRCVRSTVEIMASAVMICLFVVCVAYLVNDSYNPFLYFRF